MPQFAGLVDILLCREKFSPLALLLRHLLQRVEQRHGETSPQFFTLLQQLLEVQFWAKDLKEVDALCTHLGRLRDKHPLDNEHFLAKAVEAGMGLVLRKEWNRVLVEMRKAASDLSRLRSDLNKRHVVAQLDAQNAGVGGADASREEALERDLLNRMAQIDVYLCTSNMLYAIACVAYSGKESLPSVQQQQWFAASYSLARDVLHANARITLSIRMSHGQWLMDRKMFAYAATIYEDIAINLMSTYCPLSFIHDTRLVLALRSLSRCFMHFYDTASAIAVIDVAIELSSRLFGPDDPRSMQLVVDKSDVVLGKMLLTAKDLDQVEADLTRVHATFSSILHKIQRDMQILRESRVFDPNKSDRPAVFMSQAEMDSKRLAVRNVIFTTPPPPEHIAAAAEAEVNAAPKMNGKLKAVATVADAWCDMVLFTPAVAADDILGFAVNTIDVNIRSDMVAYEYTPFPHAYAPFIAFDLTRY